MLLLCLAVASQRIFLRANGAPVGFAARKPKDFPTLAKLATGLLSMDLPVTRLFISTGDELSPDSFDLIGTDDVVFASSGDPFMPPALSAPRQPTPRQPAPNRTKPTRTEPKTDKTMAGSVSPTGTRAHGHTSNCERARATLENTTGSTAKLFPLVAPPYTGEFGHELTTVLPLLHTLARCQLLAQTTSCGDLSVFYSFSPQHHVDRACFREAGRESYLGVSVRNVQHKTKTTVSLPHSIEVHQCLPHARGQLVPCPFRFRVEPPPLLSAVRRQESTVPAVPTTSTTVAAAAAVFSTPPAVLALMPHSQLRDPLLRILNKCKPSRDSNPRASNHASRTP